MGQDEQSAVALKSVIFKTVASGLQLSFWCDDVHDRHSCRDNDEERLERLQFVFNQTKENGGSICPTLPYMCAKVSLDVIHNVSPV